MSLTGCFSARDTVVSGKFENIADGTVVLLSRLNELGETEIIGSDTVRDNGFRIDLGFTEQP